MKVLILYKPNSEHSREVEEYVEELKKRSVGSPIRFEVLNATTAETKPRDLVLAMSVRRVAQQRDVVN